MNTPRPDFLRPQAGPHPLAWVGAASGLLVLAVATLDAHTAWQARASAQAALDAASAPAAAPPAPRRDAEAERRALQLRQALARLQRPWPAVFSALDALDAPGVAWLALDVADSGALRLEGLAPDAAAATAAAGQLRRALPEGEVLLGRLDAQPGGGQRFELSARGWR